MQRKKHREHFSRSLRNRGGPGPVLGGFGGASCLGRPMGFEPRTPYCRRTRRYAAWAGQCARIQHAVFSSTPRFFLVFFFSWFRALRECGSGTGPNVVLLQKTTPPKVPQKGSPQRPFRPFCFQIWGRRVLQAAKGKMQASGVPLMFFRGLSDFSENTFVFFPNQKGTYFLKKHSIILTVHDPGNSLMQRGGGIV